MDKSKQPGIKIIQILLESSKFSRFPTLPPNMKLELKLKKTSELHPDGKTLITSLTLDVNNESSPLYFSATYLGIFQIESEKKKNMNLEDFQEIHAPGILYPYLREEFQSRISKSELSAIIKPLPPLNIPALLKKNKKD
jgi:preprotein translocase subunit SecB